MIQQHNLSKPLKEDIEEMYWVKCMSIREIGKLYEVSYSAVHKWIRDYGIETRTNSESRLVNSMNPQKEDLEKMYWGDGMSTYEIGELYGASNTAVQSWMKDYGIETRTLSEAKLVNSTKPPKKDLEEMYWSRGMSTYEIGELCGVSSRTILNWMRNYEIEMRTLSEARINGDFTGENSNGWKGGISGGKYCYKFNNRFKEAVRKRDDYTCQLCGFEQNGRRLSVHHIHYLKDDCYPDVVALCDSCHSKVNINRDYWEKYFEDLLIDRGLYCWSLSQET